MAKKIEILENTLLKLLVRRGTNQDRQSIKLSEGELGYTTDTNRLYVGDGSTDGGIVVGNKFLGSDNDVTTFVNANEGDLAYDSNDRVLYAFSGNGLPTDIANWTVISSVTDEGSGNISVGKDQIRADIAGAGLEVVGGQLAIDCQGINTNKIDKCPTGTVLQLPNTVQYGGGGAEYQYSMPSRQGSVGKFLVGDNNGNLTWSNEVGAGTVTYFSTAEQPVPVGTIAAFADLDAVGSSWILCNGNTYDKNVYPDLFDIIEYDYGGSDPLFAVPDLNDKVLFGSDTKPTDVSDVALGSGGAVAGDVVTAHARFAGSNASTTVNSGFSSIVRNSAGVYTLTFATPRSSANSYVVNATRDHDNPREGDVIVRNRTTNSFVLHSSNDNSSAGDPVALNVVVVESGDGGVSNSSGIDAAATVYAIKAVADPIVSSTMTARSPLTAAVDGVQQGENPFNSLEGDIEVGLGNNISVNSVTTNDITVNNEITFSDSTTLSTAPVSTGLGIGQSYSSQVVTASTPLKNTSDRSWFVTTGSNLGYNQSMELRNTDTDPWLLIHPADDGDRGPFVAVLQPGASVRSSAQQTWWVLS